jgi:hypothetical protein
VLFDGKYNPRLLCFYGGYRSLDGRPKDPLLGGRLWPQFPWELRTVSLPMFTLTNGGGPGGSFLLGHSFLKWSACPH